LNSEREVSSSTSLTVAVLNLR